LCYLDNRASDSVDIVYDLLMWSVFGK